MREHDPNATPSSNVSKCFCEQPGSIDDSNFNSPFSYAHLLQARSRMDEHRQAPTSSVHTTGRAHTLDRTTSSVHDDAYQLAALLDAAPQLMWTASADGRFLYCNSQLRWLLGAVIGHPVEDILAQKLLDPEDRERWRESWRRCIAEQCTEESQWRMRDPRDGSVHWLLERRMRLDDRKLPDRWLVIAMQIDESKRCEEELLAQLRGKQRFFASLLHELRNPLAPIAHAIEVIERHPDDPPIVSHAGKLIERQLRQLTRLVDDLIDMSRMARSTIRLRRRPVDVRRIIDGAIETAQPLLDARQHVLVIRAPRTPLVISADPMRLRQILTNLLINSAKYTNPGGRIHILVEHDPANVTITIKDNGIGIPSELLPRIFDLFVRAAPDYDADLGGMGVGLAVARELTELHGGSLSAHSDGPGMGSAFTICLPACIATRAIGDVDKSD